MKRRLIAIPLGCVLVAAIGLCGWWGYNMNKGCWPGRPEGLVSDMDVIADFVDMCGVTPEDTYMIDLRAFVSNSVAHKTPEEIRYLLIEHRQTKGDEPFFLVYNPASLDPIPDYNQLRWVYFSVRADDKPENAGSYREVLIDMTQSIMWAQPWWSILISHEGAIQTPLTPDQRAELVALLQTTSVWTPQSNYTPLDWIPSHYAAWDLVLCDQDYTIHRFGLPSSEQEAPPGFEDFAAAMLHFAGLTE